MPTKSEPAPESSAIVLAPAARPVRRVPLATTAPALVPARMINEALYCERGRPVGC